MQIPLNHGKIAVIDDADASLVSGYRWRAGKGRNTWYAYAKGGGFFVRMHQLIAGACSGEQVDHRDGNGLNNTRTNLRKCSIAENIRNGRCRRNNTSGFKGVSWDRARGRWAASIRFNRKIIHLGRHESATEAARAYDAAARQHHGAFARLNFPGGEG